LQALRGDAGGKHLFDDPRFELRTVAFEPAAVDIDTEEDLEIASLRSQ
jgi:CTP:molybdopterin cytidylyltransferase MocA